MYIFDPYSIALSKLDRGFDTDIEDIVFLLERDYVGLGQLEEIMRDAIEHAYEFNLYPSAMRAHLRVVCEQL
ncbi:MAG: hypothetical protein JXM73_22210 [Anaerolineae bacterium]|nr:hypothetical protein [Anaerolineae bacterium]